MKILIIHFLGALIFLTFSPASDWPKFRGPTGDGHANVKSIPLNWSATENVKWKVPVPGKGWSSPVLSGGKIYLTTAFAEGDNQDAAGVKRELRALCFDAETGKTVWDTKVFDQGASSKAIHKKNSHASPTPIIENGKVYVHFGHMGTACLDLKGKIIWTNDDLGYNPLHGNGGTPIIVDELLISEALI